MCDNLIPLSAYKIEVLDLKTKQVSKTVDYTDSSGRLSTEAFDRNKKVIKTEYIQTVGMMTMKEKYRYREIWMEGGVEKIGPERTVYEYEFKDL